MNKMKYRQLTKEQFESLNEEFAKFLATQQIDVKEWETIKKEKPEMAEEELNIFSDVVWEDVLTKTEYLEHVSEHHINLFKCTSKEFVRIFIKLNDKTKSFLNQDDYNWFLANHLDDSFEYFKASKAFTKERNIEIFELIEMGAQISKGGLFNAISKVIH